MSPPEPLNDLVKKLYSLTVTDSTERNSSKRFGPPVDGEIKAALNEISKLELNQESEVPKKIAKLIKSILTWKNKDQFVDTEISNILGFLKALAETPILKSNKNGIQENQNGLVKLRKDDIFWKEIILPNVPDIYNFFTSVVLSHCKIRFEESRPADKEDVSFSGGGYAYHQLLGLLQKGIRTLIVYLKRSVVNSDIFSKSSDNVILLAAENVGHELCNFLNRPIDVGLDIRCNFGLALAHIVVLKLNGTGENFSKFCKEIFSSPTPKSEKGIEDKLFQKIYSLCVKDVNRISFAVGVLNCLDSEKSTNYSELMFLIGNNILKIDHGTKEATNLGSARVIEMWSDKLAHPSIPLKTLDIISPLFGQLEFFIFNYIPGHIDAVKNCSRNILSCLTKIYSRLSGRQDFPIQEDRRIDYFMELLRKILVQAPHVKYIAMACVVKNSKDSIKILELQNELSHSLLCAQRTCQNAASESYIGLMSYEFSTIPISVWEKRWVAPLFETQQTQNNESNWPQKRAIVFNILNSDKSLSYLQAMIQPILNFVVARMNHKVEKKKVSSSCELGVAEATLLAAEVIKIASELGLTMKMDNFGNDESFRGLVPRSVLHSWFWHENPQIRLAGFSLFVETKKSSELIPKVDLKSLKILLKYNLVSQNPAFRQQFVAYFKKLLKRLKDSFALLKRKRDIENIKNYEEFFPWLWKFFAEEEGLFIGANFGRRCQSLECMSEMIIAFEDFPLFGVYPEDKNNMKYLSWLNDSYENNKVRALDILEKMPLPSFRENQTCDQILNEALTLCESVRPPDSVTGRYLMVLLMKKSVFFNNEKYSTMSILSSLILKLEDTFVKIQDTSLTEVSSNCPMYGIIRCIRMIFNCTDEYLNKPQQYQDYATQLIDLFLKYDNVLFPVLGNPAPEGFLPELSDSSEDNTQVIRSLAAQMLLVCSWRSMRDISLTLADMCLLFPLFGESRPPKRICNGCVHILTFEQVSTIGDHMLYLMRNLVHRGVFEQIFVGFKTLATRLWKSDNPKLTHLPEKWLQEAMDEEHINSKSITRRSAGLPFIFQALLSAESENEALMAKWVQRLFIKDESPENCYLRIHAMNVLRGLFKDTNFSKAMMPFVPDGLRIAFCGLKSDDWNERNSGLMLYGAVIRRTFGANLNLMSAPTFFRKFPQMYDFLLGELEVCLSSLRIRVSKKPLSNGTDHHITSDFTFHLLLLLSSFAPVGRVEDEHFRLSEFIPRLQECGKSPDMEVRKLAAKAIMSFLISPDDKRSLVLSILKDLTPLNLNNTSLNFLHGTLIQVATIIQGISKTGITRTEISNSLYSLLSSDTFWKIKSPTIFESLAMILLALDDYNSSINMELYQKLEKSYAGLCKNKILKNRHFIPGLPTADIYLANAKINFYLNSANESQFGEIIYNWLATWESTSTFIEQLLEYICENPNLLDIFNKQSDERSIMLDCLLKRYLNENIEFIGQSVLELKFLKLLTLIHSMTFNSWWTTNETDYSVYNMLLNRITEICTESSATTEHKRLALVILSKIAFMTDAIVSPELQTTLSNILVEWSDSEGDDDLRFGAAHCIPEIPFKRLLDYTLLNQCKIWLAILKLAQDDDHEVRFIIDSKLYNDGTATACARKSLEVLMDIFFKNIVEPYPLYGLALILGLMFRDDEIKAEEADDEDDGRLFDKSEMNMYSEPIILSRIVRKAASLSSLKQYKDYFDQCLTPELVDLYELASNSKLFFCSPTFNFIMDVLKKKEKFEREENEESVSLVIPLVPQRNNIHCIILRVVQESFF